MINYLYIIVYCVILMIVLAAPVHFGGLNKKPTYDLVRIKIAAWAFGWTGIGYLYAMWLAFTPNPPDA